MRRYPLVFLSPILLLLLSTTLPDSMPLSEVTGNEPGEVDPKLTEWLKAHADNGALSDLPEAEFKMAIQKFDSWKQAFLELRYANINNRPTATALSNALAALDKVPTKGVDVALVPYFYDEILETPRVDLKTLNAISQKIREIKSQSCPEKEQILRDVNDELAKRFNASEFQNLLGSVDKFKSRNFRQDALGALLDALPSDQQEAYRSELTERLKEFPKLLEDNQWVLDAKGQKSAVVPIQEPFRSFAESRSEATKKHCRTARTSLENGIAKSLADSSEHWNEVTAVLPLVDECFRRKGEGQRLGFWRQIEKNLNQYFGFKGLAHAKRKLGAFYWSQDRFEEARTIFKELLDEATAKQNLEVQEEALFTLARIEENASQFENSLRYYQLYTERFPKGKNVLEVQQNAVILYASLRKPDEALEILNKIIGSQATLTLDEQSGQYQSFALFWAGRFHYQKGDKSLAYEMWRRVASEFYSTFYGALGHYILEKATERHFRLEPSRSRSFTRERLVAEFDDQEKAVISRVENLLAVGMREEAVCELSEIKINLKEDDRILMKALLQYAAGDWLAAIRNYDTLGRAFRNGLPIGFEKLLFPRAYDDLINGYSKKLGIDSDFVFSIIRQESVFNPKAMSGAGASGLMQLMPMTAKVEARRLPNGYLPPVDRQRVMANARKNDRFFDIETNLALGVHHVHRLFKTYGNPIHVLTSYNANPKATARWKEKFVTDDFLIFTERIPYAETKKYVKLVLRNYFYYKRWYKGPVRNMPHLDLLADASLSRR